MAQDWELGRGREGRVRIGQGAQVGTGEPLRLLNSRVAVRVARGSVLTRPLPTPQLLLLLELLLPPGAPEGTCALPSTPALACQPCCRLFVARPPLCRGLFLRHPLHIRLPFSMRSVEIR